MDFCKSKKVECEWEETKDEQASATGRRRLFLRGSDLAPCECFGQRQKQKQNQKKSHVWINNVRYEEDVLPFSLWYAEKSDTKTGLLIVYMHSRTATLPYLPYL